MNARLLREHAYGYLTSVEAETLRTWCSLLMDDHRGEIIQFIISHIEQVLFLDKGEGHRMTGAPAIRVLIRQGLKAIDETGWFANSQPFFQLDEASQRNIMLLISEDRYPFTKTWENIPQKYLFQKAPAAKCGSLRCASAHLGPREIGFGGPVYPRGDQLNTPYQLESWEAVKRT